MKTNLRSHYYQPHFIDFLNSLCPFRRQKPHQKCEQGKCNKKNNYVILKSSYVQRETKTKQQEERNDRCEGQLTTSSSETDSPREASFWMRAPAPHPKNEFQTLLERVCYWDPLEGRKICRDIVTQIWLVAGRERENLFIRMPVKLTEGGL